MSNESASTHSSQFSSHLQSEDVGSVIAGRQPEKTTFRLDVDTEQRLARIAELLRVSEKEALDACVEICAKADVSGEDLIGFLNSSSDNSGLQTTRKSRVVSRRTVWYLSQIAELHEISRDEAFRAVVLHADTAISASAARKAQMVLDKIGRYRSQIAQLLGELDRDMEELGWASDLEYDFEGAVTHLITENESSILDKLRNLESGSD